MKEIVTWQLQVRIGKEYRMSPEYQTAAEACSKLLPFVEKFQMRYTQAVVVRNVRYVAEVKKA